MGLYHVYSLKCPYHSARFGIAFLQIMFLFYTNNKCRNYNAEK